MEGKQRLLQLLAFTTGPAIDVVQQYFEFKIIPQGTDFEGYLNDPQNKHKLYHERYPKIPCCECIRTTSIAAPSKRGCLVLKQFSQLYDESGTVNASHEKKKVNQILQECICKVSAQRSIKITDIDLTLLNAIIQNCCSLHTTTIISRWMIDIKEVRNTFAHLGDGRLDKNQFDQNWKKLKNATMQCAGDIGHTSVKMFQMAIDQITTWSMVDLGVNILQTTDKLTEVREDLNGIIPMVKLVCNQVDTQGKDLTVVKSEVELTKDIIEKVHYKSQQGEEELRKIKKDIGDVKHSISKIEVLIALALQRPEEKPEGYDKGEEKIKVNLDVDATCASWDEKKTTRILEHEFQEVENCEKTNDYNGNIGFQLEKVENKCIHLELSASPDVFKSPDNLIKAIKSLIRQFVKAGKLDYNVPATVNINIKVKSVLTSEEKNVVYIVFGENETLDGENYDARLPLFVSAPTIEQDKQIASTSSIKLSFEVPTTRVPNENKFVQTDLTKMDIETMERESGKPLCEPCEARARSTIAQYICHDCKVKYCQTCTDKHSISKNTRYHRIGNIPKNMYIYNPEPLYSSSAEEHIMMKRSKNHQLSNEIFGFTKRHDQDVPYTDIADNGNQKEKKGVQERLRDVKQHLLKNKTSKPGKPYVTEEVNKSDHVMLKWNHDGELGVGKFFQISMKQHPNGKWKIFHTLKPLCNHFAEVDGLKAETSYMFKVRVANDATGEEGPFSPESDVIVTGESPALKIMKRSEKIADGIPAVYRLPIKEIPHARNEASQTRKFILGTPGHNTREKTVMIVGATGSGKSTLINGMANYAMGVTLEDPFRFALIHLETCEKERIGNEALSQTEWITCYTICSEVASRIPYTINFIDTPGFGDTRGLKQDAKIVSQIRDLFTAKGARGVATLDAVCFILKAPDARLTTIHKYIFESILALFGNDIKNNICTLVTFADGQRPPVLAALEALEGTPLPFTTYFPFNNSALFLDNRADHQGTLSPFFWEMGMKSCGDFFQSLDGLQTRSLLLTAEVMTIRQKLENTILHLQEEIDLGLSKINLLEQEMNILTKYKRQIKDNENFEYEVEESFIEKVDISGKGINTTTCLTCNFTCHNNCDCSNDRELANCCAMGTGGNCTECPKNCHWSQHANVPYVFQWYTKKVKKTYSEMKDKYHQAHQKKMSQEEVLEEIHEGIKVLEIGIALKVEEITEYGNRLKEIALRPDPLSTVQYIEMMIESEKREKKSGFNQRIEILEQCKKRAEIGKTLQICEHRLRDTRATLNTSTAADDSMSSNKDQKGSIQKKLCNGFLNRYGIFYTFKYVD